MSKAMMDGIAHCILHPYLKGAFPPKMCKNMFVMNIGHGRFR